MAGRSRLADLLAPTFVIAAVLAGFVPLVFYALGHDGSVVFDGYVWRILRFTLWQATLSTLLSVVPAMLVARALARRRYWARDILLAFFGLPLALPTIVAVLGIAEVYGTSGWLGGWFKLYGLIGILITHVFFNLPLATRLFLQALESIPAENYRLAGQLGFSDWQHWYHVDWPVLRSSVGHVAALVFLLCAASFVVVLTFGGGPQATTLEVAIFQSLRADFDVTRAVSLSLIQIVVCGMLVFLTGTLPLILPSLAPLRQSARRFDGQGFLSRMTDAFLLVAAHLLLVPPLLAVVGAGLTGIEPAAVLMQALYTSIGIGLMAAFVCCALAWQLAQNRLESILFNVVPLLALIVPPAVIATGWFILTKGWSGGMALALLSIVLLNALMALPFAVSVLVPQFVRLLPHHDRLCAQLGIAGFSRFRLIDGPAMVRPLAQAFLMTFVLSLGDLTAVTLLGSQGLVTFPSLISQQMGAYRSSAAGGTALVLVVMCYGLTLLAQRVGRTA
jgi:thiamine transport system permease protein